MSEKIYINGYFLLSNKNSGVYRFSYNILIHLDLLSKQDNYNLCLVVPDNCNDIPQLKNTEVVMVKHLFNQYFWEQISLPLLVKSSLLINLANFGPVFKYNQLSVIHDALVFKYPQSYSKKFVCLTKVIYSLLFKNSKYIATVSEFSKAELEACIKTPRDDVVVLGNSAEHINSVTINDSIITENNIQKFGYILCVFSQKNSIYKNVELIAVIADKLLLPVVCVGGVDIALLKNSNNCMLLGNVNDSELKALYKYAKVFIMPSFYEGFGIPILEAMETGCPVIASNINVFREICGDAVSYIDPYNHPNALATINNLLCNDIKSDQIKQQYNIIIKRYRWNIFAKEIVKLINNDINLT